MEQVRIVPTAELYADGFHHVVGVVARERRYIGFVEAPPIEGTRAFLKSLVAGAGIQMLAVTEGGTVVGWCPNGPQEVPRRIEAHKEMSDGPAVI